MPVLVAKGTVSVWKFLVELTGLTNVETIRGNYQKI